MIPIRRVEVGTRWRDKSNLTIILVVEGYDFDTGMVMYRYLQDDSYHHTTRDRFLLDFIEDDAIFQQLKQLKPRRKMTREEMHKVMDGVIAQMQEFRAAGQKEYARTEDNAFANFERVAERLKISREKVLMVYLEKHLDGIHAYTDGHTSQREDVRGRIIDGIVYLTLLYGMVEENEDYAGKVNPTPRS